MSRELPTLVQDELTEKVIQPFFAVEIDFDSGPLYLWSGYGDFTINGKLYLGAGQLLNISSVEETTELEAKGATITMSGIPSSFLALALDEPYQGRECRIYFGIIVQQKSLLTQASDNIINQASFELTTESGVSADMAEIFAGELDQMNISETGDSCTIAVTAENILIKLDRPIVRRLTNQDQKSRFPDDKGLEYVSSLQDKEIFWGRTAKN